MTIYNTYAEAKIANPDSEIYKHVQVGTFATQEYVEKFSDWKSWDCWVKCHIKDYCMSLSEFLAEGHKLVTGDIVLSKIGTVVYVDSGYWWNKPHDKDKDRYVLRAKALETQPVKIEVDTTPQQIENSASDMWKPLNQGMSEIKNLPKGMVIEIKYDESGDVCEWTVENALKILKGPWRYTKSWRVPVKNQKEAQQPKVSHKVPTKVEYVKVEYTHVWEIMKMQSEGVDFYIKSDDVESGYSLVQNNPTSLLVATTYDLYRRIEKELTWQEHVESVYPFIEFSTKNRSVHINTKQSIDEDVYLDICRVSLRAIGEIE